MKIISFIIISLMLATISYGNHVENSNQRPFISVDTLPSSSLISYLSTVDVTQFYGHPVDSFLNTISNAIIYQKVRSCTNDQDGFMTACMLDVRYYPKLYIRIYVQNFTHMTPYDTSRNWSTTLFRQENISAIKIGYDREWVNGKLD